MLVAGPLFRLARVAGAPDRETRASYGDALVLAIPLDLPVTIGGELIVAGSCGIAPSLTAIDFANGGLCLIAQPCK